MPALELFGRRSRVGSDDFFCPALLQFMFQIPFVLVCVLYVSTYRTCSTMQIHNLSGLGFWYMLLSIPVLAFVMIMNVLELHVSSQGTIITHESRILMKPLVVVHFAWAVGMFGGGTAGVVLYAMDQLCFPDANFVLVVAVGYLANVLGMVLFACLVIGGTPVHQRRHSCDAHMDVVDPENHTLLYGNSDPALPNSDLYIPHQERWERQCHRCCACVRCFTCSLFGGSGTQTDAMSVVASVFARFFYGSPDLVFSDIIAGFVLLGAVQYHEKNAAAASPDVLREVGVVPTFPAPLDDPKDVALVAAVADLAHFSKYAIGIYGWMLYVWSHPWTSGPRLVLRSLTTRGQPYIHGDNCVHWHQVALQLETGVADADIVYASFGNAVCKPAFCVTLDHHKKQVVIAIRGTLSLEDCLTDAIAYGVSLDEMAATYQCDGKGAFAHQGMLQCALWLMQEISALGMLPMLFDPTAVPSTPPSPIVNGCLPGTYADYGLTITGHSLGAGAAVLLSIMLRPRYPTLKCLALSPPGCLMSPELATSSASFVTSVVLGKDIIARASLLSFQALRDQVLSLIGRSKVNKTHIMRQALSWRHPDELLHATEDDAGHTVFTTQLLNYRTMLQRIQAKEPIHEMWLPGRIVHLKRLVRSRGHGFCLCCRPGGGVCCTERTHYDYVWAHQTDFLQIYVARTMLDDHFPDKVHAVLQDMHQD
ncbi:hypothetical protein H257_10685 [Aphanomyces astaci]|uniref:sn-1-specific diacylglycerol lipase n=2 Tax=Aphanomyces astaci TaxID=112090 RepID=W4G853_APHAT|nr:hypothetical protein H257_10685 [Aphanomyces astaci]ETV75108.1 hypothetical protein H257_10685 [Aphanomyces astaci]|eukprot:XP_009835613.1 hypothetical protein H257_10685 [Aphanomyces astaci]